MGGSFAPPSPPGGGISMPIPLLHVNGVPPSADIGDAVNRTVASTGGDLGTVVWNQTTLNQRSASLCLAVGPPVANNADNQTYIRSLRSGVATETLINSSGGPGSLIDLAIGGNIYLRSQWPTAGQQKISAFRPFEATQGIKTTQVDSITPQLNLRAGGNPVASLFDSGGTFFGDNPIDPGFGAVQIGGTLIAERIELNGALGSVIHGSGINGADIEIINGNNYAIVVNEFGHTNIFQALQVKGGTHLVDLVGYETVLTHPFGSSDFAIGIGESLEFVILTGGSYTKGAVVATWKGAAASIGELRLHARVSNTGEVTLRVTNEAATAINLSNSASFPVTLCILGFNYAFGSPY